MKASYVVNFTNLINFNASISVCISEASSYRKSLGPNITSFDTGVKF